MISLLVAVPHSIFICGSISVPTSIRIILVSPTERAVVARASRVVARVAGKIKRFQATSINFLVTIVYNNF